MICRFDRALTYAVYSTQRNGRQNPECCLLSPLFTVQHFAADSGHLLGSGIMFFFLSNHYSYLTSFTVAYRRLDCDISSPWSAEPWLPSANVTGSCCEGSPLRVIRSLPTPSMLKRRVGKVHKSTEKKIYGLHFLHCLPFSLNFFFLLVYSVLLLPFINKPIARWQAIHTQPCSCRLVTARQQVATETAS